MMVRLTQCCLDLLRLVRAAYWLTTGQVRRRFFPRATPDAVHKYLRKLTKARYLVMVREHRMAEALFTLGPEAKRVLERRGAEEIVLERTPPKHLEHFLGINDLRIAAELSGRLTYFLAYWELPGARWRHAVIPDAVLSLARRSFAIEFDRDKEGIRYFIRRKVAVYLRGIEGFALGRLLIIADRKARVEALAKRVSDPRGRILYTTLDEIREKASWRPSSGAGRNSLLRGY